MAETISATVSNGGIVIAITIWTVVRARFFGDLASLLTTRSDASAFRRAGFSTTKKIHGHTR